MTVYLVGAGPGDPGLLTVRGAEVLATADVVVYDRLSVGSLLELAPPHAERISVGKQPGRVTLPQADINALLVERGRAGQQVVRLKGGDPFVFARGGEEAAALLEAGVPFEVVPGITSAIAVPAYAGIPVTMRHSSTSFTVVTGHEDPSKEGELDWDAVARLGGTIVVLMGVARLPQIVSRLIDGGLPPDTPVAAVHWGTRSGQQTTRSTLAGIVDAELEPPATIVIGKVAALDLRWFEDRPLLGRRVVVTRPRDQAAPLVDRLRLEGAEPIVVPTICITDPDDGGAALREAARSPHEYAWVVVTSANGAARLLDAIHDARDLGGVQVAAIGSGTAEALARGNVIADLVPEQYVAEALLDAFPPAPAGASAPRVLLARAAVARDVLPDGLRAKGWHVDVIEAYRTVPVVPDDGDRALVAGADVVTFTSSSTVESFVGAFGTDACPPLVACIGPVTAATARDLGLDVHVVASTHTSDGLVDALVARLARVEPADRVDRADRAEPASDVG